MSETLRLFVFIFLASLPGRTTFVLLMLSTTGNKWRIFCGASLALLIQVLISILASQALALISKVYSEAVAGLLFWFFAYRFWTESQKLVEDVDIEISSSIRMVFIVVFMAELGDVSQLAIATAASRASSKIIVFSVGVAALWLITAMAVLLGARLGQFLNPKNLQKLAAAGFVIIGAYLIFHSLVTLLT